MQRIKTTAAVIVINDFLISIIDLNFAVLITSVGYEIQGVSSPSATGFEFELVKRYHK